MASEQFERLKLEKVLLVDQRYLAGYDALDENMKVSVLRASAEDVCLMMKSWCVAGQIPMRTESETVRWADGWWEAFKEQYGPRWLKKWFPVVYAERVVEKTTHIYFVCPHVNPSEDKSLHYRFMATGTPLAEKM